MQAACISLRPAPLVHVSVGHQEQRIKPNPAKPRQLDQKYPSAGPICPEFSARVNRSWHRAGDDCPVLLFRCHTS